MVRLLLFLGFVCLAVSQGSADDTTTTIVAFGDSLFAGYGLLPEEAFPAQLERRLRADGYNVTVINDGISGDTTGGGVARVDQVIAQRPEIILLAFGGNDLLRVFPPDVTRKNLSDIMTKVKKANIRMLLIGQKAPLTLGLAYANAFNAIYPDLAKQFGAGLYSSFLEGVYGRQEFMQSDGVHPNKDGVAQVVNNIYPLITPGLKKQR